MKIKVLIADDNSFVREGLKIILNSFEEFEVVAAVEDGDEAVDYCLGHDVDVALLDVRMPRMNGVEAARRLAAETGVMPFILTTFDDDEYILEAIRAGARGYLLKNNDPEQIRDAIRSVFHGHRVLQDVVLDKIRSNLAAPDGGGKPAEQAEAGSTGHDLPPPGSRIDRSRFTERELEIMALIARGLSNREISRKLYISEGTTANYITSILNKTGLEHRTQIAIYYLTGEVRTAED
jgi:DNA-binding NarL/FixJ family response regulator